MTTTTQLGRDIGQAENALRAILVDILKNTPLNSYAHYVAMTLVAAEPAADERAVVEDQLANAAKISATEAATVMDDLVEAELIDAGPDRSGVLSLSITGAHLLHQVRAEIAAVNARVYAGISGHDLDVAKQTLAVIHGRANAELARRNR